MHKIYTVLNNVNVETSVLSGFLDFCPGDKFTEVENPMEADAVFMFGNLSDNHTNIRFGDHTLENNQHTMMLAQALDQKCRIIWLDSIGPTVASETIPRGYRDFVRPDDIPVSPSSLPDHPNKQEHVYHIPSYIFYHIDRFQRKPKSMVIMGDQFSGNIDMIRSIIPHIDQVFVTNTDNDDMIISASPEKNKIKCGIIDYPFGIRKVLSQYEYVLNIHEWVGMELMGFEGGFCGSHPIYPDTQYYRDLFHDFDGVALFDTNNPVDSIVSIINKKSDWVDNHMADFVKKYSAENHLPQFWNNVSDILDARKTAKTSA